MAHRFQYDRREIAGHPVLRHLRAHCAVPGHELAARSARRRLRSAARYHPASHRSGRDELERNAWSEYESEIARLLELLTEQEAHDFLVRKGVISEAVIKVILQLSGRSPPLLVATLAAERPDDPAKVWRSQRHRCGTLSGLDRRSGASPRRRRRSSAPATSTATSSLCWLTKSRLIQSWTGLGACSLWRSVTTAGPTTQSFVSRCYATNAVSRSRVGPFLMIDWQNHYEYIAKSLKIEAAKNWSEELRHNLRCEAIYTNFADLITRYLLLP